MARNYYQFWIARTIKAGAYKSFADETRSKVETAVTTYLNANPTAVLDIATTKAYVKLNKTNAVGLIKTWLISRQDAWGSTWSFLQDGLIATESPRDDWSHGH